MQSVASPSVNVRMLMDKGHAASSSSTLEREDKPPVRQVHGESSLIHLAPRRGGKPGDGATSKIESFVKTLSKKSMRQQ